MKRRTLLLMLPLCVIASGPGPWEITSPTETDSFNLNANVTVQGGGPADTGYTVRIWVDDNGLYERQSDTGTTTNTGDWERTLSAPGGSWWDYGITGVARVYGSGHSTYDDSVDFTFYGSMLCKVILGTW